MRVMKRLCVQTNLTYLHGCFGNDVGGADSRINGVLSQGFSENRGIKPVCRGDGAALMWRLVEKLQVQEATVDLFAVYFWSKKQPKSRCWVL